MPVDGRQSTKTCKNCRIEIEIPVALNNNNNNNNNNKKMSISLGKRHSNPSVVVTKMKDFRGVFCGVTLLLLDVAYNSST